MTRNQETLKPYVDRLENLDVAFRSIESLLEKEPPRNAYEIGDFRLAIWADHGLLPECSIATLERVRFDGCPFPSHGHDQNAWLVCVRGSCRIRLDNGGADAVLVPGAHFRSKPGSAHSIYPESRDCACILLTVPADPGLRGE